MIRVKFSVTFSFAVNNDRKELEDLQTCGLLVEIEKNGPISGLAKNIEHLCFAFWVEVRETPTKKLNTEELFLKDFVES